MTEREHEHDTEPAPTEAAELAEQTTELPPTNNVAATPEAWSLDDTAEVEPSPPRGRLISAGLVALVVVIAGALIFLATTLFGSRSPKSVEPTAQPTSTVPVAVPPPPPETPPPTPSLAVRCGPAGCTPQPVAPTTAAAPNGVYRFDYPASGSGLDAVGPSSVWWKFSSECARDGCTAIGQGVTGADHRALVAGEFEIYTFSGGMWHLQVSPPSPNDDAPNVPHPAAGCEGGGQTLVPQPDGSFLGINTAIVPPCGSANTNVRTFQVVKVSS